MLFNSLQFALFFPIVTALYFYVPKERRELQWLLLLAASCVFYMAFVPAYILILFVLILVDYAAGLLIERSKGTQRTAVLAASLVANIGMLAFFKYFNFFNSNIAFLAEQLHWRHSIKNLSILLPIGLSFHTFQSMSYTIEVYKRRQRAERHIGIYALYVLFYPQLVAGPIERPQHLLHQFRKFHCFDSERVKSGLRLMAIGFFKKMAISDRLAIFVNMAYDDPHRYAGWPLIIATYLFTFQIYCDFSGYTDIARGAAEVMGYRLIPNFNHPYSSASISEFWKRWHMSLSSWFRDYLYIPLGGNKVSTRRRCFNLLVVFMVSGLWHGAKWTFVIWGALHGLFLVTSILTKKWRSQAAKLLLLQRWPRVTRYVSIFVTFHLVAFSWIFFRANTVRDAFFIVSHMGTKLSESIAALHIDLAKLEVAALLVVGLQLSHLGWQGQKGILEFFSKKPRWMRWIAYYAAFSIFYSLVITSGIEKPQQFIYFQF